MLCYHAVRRNDAPAGSMAFEGLHVRAVGARGALPHDSRDMFSDSPFRVARRRGLTSREARSRDFRRRLSERLHSGETDSRALPSSGRALRYHPAGDRAKALLVRPNGGEISANPRSRMRRTAPMSSGAVVLAEIFDGASSRTDPHAPLTVEQQSDRLPQHPLFELGGHTSNPSDPGPSGADVQRREIEENRKELEARDRRPSESLRLSQRQASCRLQRGVDSAGPRGELRSRFHHSNGILVSVRISMGTITVPDAFGDLVLGARPPPRLQLAGDSRQVTHA